MSDNTVAAIVIISVTAIVIARIWASTKPKYPS